MIVGKNMSSFRLKLRVCLTCATLHMLKQLIVVNYFWKTTIIYSKVLYLTLKTTNMYKFQYKISILNFITCANLRMIKKS